jgi:hypothetical protein
MYIMMSLAIMLLPFSAFLLLIGRRGIRTANKPELSLTNSNRMSKSASVFDAVQPTIDPMPLPNHPQSISGTEQFRQNLQSGIAVSEMTNAPLSLEQFEVIADALEFTGQHIEKEITGTAEGSTEHVLLVEDLEHVTATLEVVVNAMDTLVGAGKQ